MRRSHFHSRELYDKIEQRLSPLLRRVLGQALPALAGLTWWNRSVVPALNSVRRNNLTREKTLEQFDYPALVGIFLHNGATLRAYLGIGNEINNYLITIKTFRNDVQHQPQLRLTLDREKIIIEAALLTAKLLKADAATLKALESLYDQVQPYSARRTRIRVLGVLSLLLISLMSAWGISDRAGVPFDDDNFWRNARYGATSVACAKTERLVLMAQRYEAIAPVSELFKSERNELTQRCRSQATPDGLVLSRDELEQLQLRVSARVRDFWLKRSTQE